MEINWVSKQTTPFEMIKDGEVFSLFDSGCLYMKIETKSAFNAVNLADGKLDAFPYDAITIREKATLNVEE
jgi:hypothetical protein